MTHLVMCGTWEVMEGGVYACVCVCVCVCACVFPGLHQLDAAYCPHLEFFADEITRLQTHHLLDSQIVS